MSLNEIGLQNVVDLIVEDGGLRSWAIGLTPDGEVEITIQARILLGRVVRAKDAKTRRLPVDSKVLEQKGGQ